MKYKRLSKDQFGGKRREGLKQLVKDMHSKDPKYIFLTDTSATPWGYFIKEAWKEAYPEEKVPIFYRINPTSLKEPPVQMSKEKIKKFQKYLKKKKIKPEDNIIIFDEFYFSGRSMNAIKDAFENPSRQFGEHCFKNIAYIEGNVGQLKKEGGKLLLSHEKKKGYGIGNLFALQKNFGRYNTWGGKKVKEDDKILIEFTVTDKDKDIKTKKFTADIKHKKGKEYLEIIKEIKSMGKEVGEEIHEGDEKRKDLEKIVSGVIGIGGLGAGLFFLQPSITGNVVNLSQNANSLVGGILLIIGLVAGFFWTKKRHQNL